jgi:hypothetical protein
VRFPLSIAFHFFAALVLLASAFPAQAAPPSATAALSSKETTVGQPVMLQVTVEASRVKPPEISVDGLTIQFVGRSTQMQMQNFNLSTFVTFTFRVAGNREGTYTIPALEFELDGKRVRTKPQELLVTAAGTSQASAGGTGTQEDDGREYAFGEIIVEADKAYVGQAIPVELRMYFDASARIRVDEMPTIESEGFTLERLPEARQTRVRKNGRVYDALTFKTIMTPVKAGEVTIGPAKTQCTISIPRKRRTNTHLDDFFNDGFFNDPFGTFAHNQKVTVLSDAPLLDVRPLPTEGQPDSFSGAIGQFTLETTASTRQVKVGEPLMLTMKVAGKGNFPRIAPPELTGDDGWRTYPGSDTFDPIDRLGLTGRKVFEVSVVPERPLPTTPGVEFSYFDPAKEEYVTLTSEPIPVTVEGKALPSTAAVSSGNTAPTPVPPDAEPAEVDIHGIAATGEESWTRSFAPLYTRVGFWAAQGIPLIGLLAFVALRIRTAHRLDTRARALEGLRREKSGAMKRLEGDDTPSDEFYAAAVRAVQIEAAIRSHRNPATIAVEDALAAKTVDPTTEQSLRRLFANRDEMIYADGPSHQRDELTPQLRDAYRRTIGAYESA